MRNSDIQWQSLSLYLYESNRERERGEDKESRSSRIHSTSVSVRMQFGLSRKTAPCDSKDCLLKSIDDDDERSCVSPVNSGKNLIERFHQCYCLNEDMTRLLIVEQMFRTLSCSIEG